jgi:hypothetical protein
VELYFLHELVCMCVVVIQGYGFIAYYSRAGVCVNGSALILCGRHMWFVGGHNIFVLDFVYLRLTVLKV